MHELAIAQGLVRSVEALACERGARAVRSVEVAVGELAGVEAVQLEAAFAVARAGSRAHAARLELRRLPVKVRCQLCAQESEVRPNRLLCAACGSWRTRVIQGEELVLRSVELELGEESHV